MSIIDSIKKYVMIAGGLVMALLYILFRIEKDKRQKAEIDLILANGDKKDAVLAEKQDQIKEQIEAEIKKAEAEKGRKLSPEEVERFWKDV